MSPAQVKKLIHIAQAINASIVLPDECLQCQLDDCSNCTSRHTTHPGVNLHQVIA